MTPSRVPADWPQRKLSRSVRVGPIDWHVQVGGHGPLLLLLHGSGASAHSWAELLPHLLPHASVVVPDLPGHGFTRGADMARLTLPLIAADLDALLAALGLGRPVLVVGHSAGAALGLRWALLAKKQPRALVGFNPSLVPPPAAYIAWLAPLITPLATSAPMASLLAGFSRSTGLVDRLLGSTGSELNPAQRKRYARLFADPGHVRGTMNFMAAADLEALQADGHALRLALTFVLGTHDAWVPEQPLRQVIAAAFPAAEVLAWSGGHLLHEAEPARAAALVLERLARCQA